MILGANGSGKSALAAAMVGEGQVTAGDRSIPDSAQLVSFESQRALIEEERAKDDSAITDEVFVGTTVGELLGDGCSSTLVEQFGLQTKLDQAFRSLSTGETRKLMLIRAIAAAPKLLILDEPFDGLDQQAAPFLSEHLIALKEKSQVVMILNRLDEVPDWVTHGVCVVNGRIAHQGSWQSEQGVMKQLLGLQRDQLVIPRPERADRVPDLAPGPLVVLNEGKVAYGENIIFEQLDWQINPQEHWQVIGPNGSGKTCLLNLITGDHPQCYTNNIKVFGYQRGQGESIWDIKQHLGYVSTALQWEYRVSISLLNVVLSGFYDSIGLYEKASEQQQVIAMQWLELLGLEHRAHQPFNQCSYGDQRLLLIARAMVKHPQLLILDEPCLGLDEVNRQLVLSLIEIICTGSETTVLYVNHHAEDRIPSITHCLDMASYS